MLFYVDSTTISIWEHYLAGLLFFEKYIIKADDNGIRDVIRTPTTNRGWIPYLSTDRSMY